MSDLPWNLSYFRDPDFIAAPVALPATAIDEDRFTANWEAAEEAVSYELEIAADLSFDELVTPGGFPLGIDALEALEFELAGLAPETEYFYRLRAVKASGTVSAYSNVVSVETLELFTAQGGDLVEYDGTYSTHYFDNDGDFEVLTGLRRVRRLLVGGGGQGGGVNGSGVSCGGGGGGEVVDLAEEDRDPMAPAVFPVVVGAGGATAGALNVGEDGDDSSFDGDTAKGGGHGGSAGSSVGDGGSGGGATNSSGSNEQGGVSTAADGLGNDGGDCPGSGGGGGAGGGGADEAGGNGTILTGGKGGDGHESDISGTPTRYGAGGGGGRPVDPFGVIGGTTAGAGGAGGGGAGASATPANGNAATGVGNGGGGALGNRAGGAGTKGQVVMKYKGRAADWVEPTEPAAFRGPITFDGCTREQEVDGVEILVDCNARIDSGIFPDFQRYLCLGGGVAQSSRSMRANDLPSELPDDPLPGGEHGIQNGTLVFRFSEPIRAFKITRRITSGTDAPPILNACDDYTVVPHPTSSVPGSSKDGAIAGFLKSSPSFAYYPTAHLEPPVNLAAEEVMEITHPDGFLCVAITQNTKFPSEFVDPMFVLLSD